MKSINKVDVLINLFKISLDQIEYNIEKINNLNVYPVPDGDTGTNMYLTLRAALNHIEKNNINNFSELSNFLSKGALMGARGNSGVILSQIFRGFSNGIKNAKIIDGKILADSFKLGEEIAYKAVKKPVEGTILTVMKGIKEGAFRASNKKNDFLFVLSEAILEGKKILKKTPEYLPILKEAGVVDAGGKGLIIILEGLYKGASGKNFNLKLKNKNSNLKSKKEVLENLVFDEEFSSISDIKFTYCTEFIILKPKKNNDNICLDLEKLKLGDSLVTVVSDDLAKIHMHTNCPDKLLNYALSIGSLINIKIDNMLEQFKKKYSIENNKKEKIKPVGFVMIVPGKGLGDIAKSMGVDSILYGGQTMNPSTNDIKEAIKKVNASTVYIFPNNKNIILASEQAAKLIKNKKIIVVPTLNIPEGFNSLIVYNESYTNEENFKLMKKSFKNIVSGSITYAVRDTFLNGFKIKKNQILSMKKNKIIGVENNIYDAMSLFLKKAYKKHDILTIYAGNMIKENEANNMKKYILKKYPDLEVILFFGKQPVYYYIMSLE